ncbi:CocE/NonD family hydrolase [Roseovarius indicus]|uniref:CocE/NonD family hydrolase n=1 Tax=Roseovarius indicus TaxID=540747 RepID=UPI000AF4B7BA|nr:CocE/NonD family hydrolase [Roseovarius indicus]
MPGFEGSFQQYDCVADTHHGVSMRDGSVLYADVYRPALSGQAVEGKWPVLLERTPYNKDRLSYSVSGRYFAKRGYVYVVQDVRGRWSSDGDFAFLRNEADDGEDTMTWLASQPWCGDRIGTVGISYTTATQQALAIRHPEKLATQVLFDGAYNYFRQTMRHGGACEYAIAFQYSVSMARTGKQAVANPRIRAQLDEMWKDLPKWLRHQPLRQGASPLRLTPDYEQWFFDMLTKSDYEDWWKTPDLAIEEYIDDYPDIPLLFETSWYGHHITATLWKYEQLKKRHKTPKKLIIGTWLHGGDMFVQTWAGDVDFGSAAALEDNNSLRLRWLDHQMKGMTTGLDEEAPVQLFVMGGGSGRKDAMGRLSHGGRWRDEQEWPLARTRMTTFHLNPDGRLAEQAPPEDAAPITYDFDPANPVPTVGGNFTNYGTTGFLEGGGYNQNSGTMSGDHSPDLPLAVRPDVIVFRTDPLEDGVEVTGVVTCTLFVSSSAPDTDFTVKLIDEYPPNEDYPNGYALNLGDSILRMRYRDGYDRAEMMTPGEVYEVQLRLQATSNFFAAGHRIRIDISSSNSPHYDVNPNTGEPLGLNRCQQVARQSLYVDRVRSSHVDLPIIPPEA